MQPEAKQDVIPAEIVGADLTVAGSALARAQRYLSDAELYVIDCPELAEAASADLTQIKTFASDLEAIRTRVKAEPLSRCQAIDSYFREPANFLKKAEALLKGSIETYLRAEQQRVAAEQERLRIESEAEQNRIQREQQRQAEALASEADRERDIALQGATTAEQVAVIEDNHERKIADAVGVASAPPPIMPTVAVISPATKLKGISSRETWVATLDDKMALIQEIAKSGRTDLAALLVFDQSAANKLAQALKQEFKAPGITVSAVSSITARKAR